nr:MAG TPA: hypothetical protein [Bacteriophage sp.]
MINTEVKLICLKVYKLISIIEYRIFLIICNTVRMLFRFFKSTPIFLIFYFRIRNAKFFL